MKKALVIIFAIVIIVISFLIANNISNDKNESNYDDNSKISSQTDTKITDKEIVNPYFFTNNISEQNYKGKFLFDDIIEQDVTLNINELANLKYGKLYELKPDPIEGINDERLNLGYFYVQEDKIYKIEPTEQNLDMLKTNEELPEDSVIVCQDTQIEDSLDDNEQGFHHYLNVNNDEREYHSYNNQVSTGYYESFTWKKDIGLTNYRSGYGAENDSIELQLVE
ncbi:hypothetical protein AN1V17_27620 [Vallitalea sediminicola]